MVSKHEFNIEQHYWKWWSESSRHLPERNQIWLWPWESVVYHNSLEILKVFQWEYTEYGKSEKYSYPDVLWIYKKRHHFWSNITFLVDPKHITWWDMILQKKIQNGIQDIPITNITIKTISLDKSKIYIHEKENVCVMKWIEYVRGTSLQSLCDGHYTLSSLFLKDTKDQRCVKVWAEEIYRIWYKITQFINDYILFYYGIYCWIIPLSFTKYWYTGLVPKNIRLTYIEEETWELEFTITDRCSSIMLWYIANSWNAIFNNFVANDNLIKKDPSLLKNINRWSSKIKHHMIDRMYIHT